MLLVKRLREFIQCIQVKMVSAISMWLFELKKAGGKKSFFDRIGVVPPTSEWSISLHKSITTIVNCSANYLLNIRSITDQLHFLR